MTTAAEARELIYERWNSQWTVLAPGVPAWFGNERADPPTDGSAWVHVFVNELVSRQDTLGAPGNRQFLREWLVTVRLFVPQDAGDDLADAYVAHVRAIFEGVALSGTVRCNTVTARGLRPDGKWMLMPVEAPFWFIETR